MMNFKTIFLKETTAAKAKPKKKAKPVALPPLIEELSGLIQSVHNTAASAIKTLNVLSNFEIVEHEQQGEKRAGYGTELLKNLSVSFTEEFWRGFSPVNIISTCPRITSSKKTFAMSPRGRS